jgi:hypothetical protein
VLNIPGKELRSERGRSERAVLVGKRQRKLHLAKEPPERAPMHNLMGEVDRLLKALESARKRGMSCIERLHSERVKV